MRYQSKIDPAALLQSASSEFGYNDPEAFKVLILALGAGLRRGEIDRLLWTQFNFKTGVINIEATEVIDRELWKADADSIQSWEGTAGELEGRLRDDYSGVKNEAMALFKWGHSCGTYLGRLANKYPARVQEARTATARKWRIKPPNPDPMDDPMF